MLAVIAVIGVLVLAAGAVYKAWNDSSSGFKETIMSMLDTVMGWGSAVGDFFVGIWNGIKGFIVKAVEVRPRHRGDLRFGRIAKTPGSRWSRCS